jgi:DNA-binding XRE family transcriptional regulator
MNSIKLSSARKNLGYTQEALAKGVGLSTKSYNRKELGLIEFSRKEIMNISEKLNFGIEEVNDIFFDNKITKRQ